MIAIPELPSAVEGEGQARAALAPRYEDIAQDGRVQLTSLVTGLGVTAWRGMAEQHPASFEAMRTAGILPILRRLVVMGEPGPFSVHVPIAYEGHYRFAREKGGDRLFLLMWLFARAPHASTFGPPPDRDAPPALVGRVFAEHVVTRPFAPPEERKVTRLDIPGIPPIPDRVHAFEDADALLGGRPLEDAGEIAFGMMHTDSNQHVNSLVYPRLFEEIVVRRLEKPDLLARAFEVRWRKPFFAGETAQARLAIEGRAAFGTLSHPGSSRPSSAIALEMG